MGKITVEIEIKTFGTPLYGLSHPIVYEWKEIESAPSLIYVLLGHNHLVLGN